ncbi:MAG: T9SS type A sorting domain-containing protein [Muribaculaceae bacterium]|nr:T9SS type A sorting domain-containing protein [Muribaculaceae bacterium]
MKKHILATLIALALAPVALVKADTSYSLLVNTLDGNTFEYAFEYLPIATFEGDEMIISDDRSAESMRYAMDNVLNMTIRSASSGVDGIAQSDHIRISTVNGILSVTGLDPETGMTVYDAAGKTVVSATADMNGCISISIENLGKGVYVVAMPGHSFKFIR